MTIAITDEDVKAWLGEQAPLFTRGLESGVDLVEVYAGKGRLSDAVLARGGIAIKLGLDYGHDFQACKGQSPSSSTCSSGLSQSMRGSRGLARPSARG